MAESNKENNFVGINSANKTNPISKDGQKQNVNVGPPPPPNALGVLKYGDQIYYITHPCTMIGRNPRPNVFLADFHLENEYVSRQHFQLFCNQLAQKFNLICLSSNGVYVNGELIKPYKGRVVPLADSCLFHMPGTNIFIHFESYLRVVGVGATSNIMCISVANDVEIDNTNAVCASNNNVIRSELVIASDCYADEANVNPASDTKSNEIASGLASPSYVNTDQTNDMNAAGVYILNDVAMGVNSNSGANAIGNHHYYGDNTSFERHSPIVSGLNDIFSEKNGRNIACSESAVNNTKNIVSAGIGAGDAKMSDESNAAMVCGSDKVILNHKTCVGKLKSLKHQSVAAHTQQLLKSDQNTKKEMQIDKQRPPFTYEQLITQAISAAPKKKLKMHQIIAFISNKYPFYRNCTHKSWHRSLRIACSRKFCKIETGNRFGNYWRIPNMKNARGSSANVENDINEEINEDMNLNNSASKTCDNKALTNTKKKIDVETDLSSEEDTDTDDETYIADPSNPFFCIPLRNERAKTDDNEYEKPPYTYKELIAQAILAAPKKEATARDIFHFIVSNHPFYANSTNDLWRNSLRENLSLNFIKFKTDGPYALWRIPLNKMKQYVNKFSKQF